MRTLHHTDLFECGQKQHPVASIVLVMTAPFSISSGIVLVLLILGNIGLWNSVLRLIGLLAQNAMICVHYSHVDCTQK